MSSIFRMVSRQRSRLGVTSLTASSRALRRGYHDRSLRFEPLEDRRLLSATVFEQSEVGYFLDSAKSALNRYDIAKEEWLSPIQLSNPVGKPTVALADSDGIYVAYDKAVYRFGLDGSGKTHLLNAQDTVQALHTDGNLLFINHSNGLYGKFDSIDKTTNTVIDTFENYVDSVYGSSIATSENRIFGSRRGISPADITYVAYNNDGTFSGGGDSPYHGDYPGGSTTWVFPGDAKVVDSSGTVYSTSGLTHLSSFGSTIVDIDFLGANVPIILKGNTLTAYTPGLMPAGSTTLSYTPSDIFVNDTSVITFTPDATLSTGFRADIVPLSQLNPPTPGEPIDPVGLPFTPDKLEMAADGTLLLYSKSNQSIFRWDPATQTYGETIPLIDTADYMAYSAQTNTVYLAYHSGLIRKIDLNAAEPVEVPFAILPSSPLGLSTAGRYVFASDGSGAWGTHYTFDPDGTLVDAVDWNHYSTEYVWNDANQKMYFFRDGISPNDLLWEEINADGITYPSEPAGGIGAKTDSPLHTSDGFVHPIHVVPDGSVVVLGSGMIHDATTLARMTSSLANSITDAAWLGNELFTIRNIAGVSQIQHWDGPNYEMVKVVQMSGTAVSLISISDKRLLSVTTDSAGIPIFTVWDENLVEVEPHDIGTTTTVAIVPNPSLYGQPVTFTANVSANITGDSTPTGTVQFVVDGVNFGSPVTLDATDHASLTASTGLTGVFSMPSGLTSLEMVTVGSPGNAGELSGGGANQGPGAISGSVSDTYEIGKYEVTAAQYAEFLNAKAATADPYGLYNSEMWYSTYGCKIQQTPVSGGYIYSVATDYANRPVNFVSYLDATRFVNWLQNGQGGGDTETGAYTLDGYNSSVTKDIVRNPGATWFIPTEDEWYKAAYYDPNKLGGAGYWDYPTGSDSPPSNTPVSPDSGNHANFFDNGLLTIDSPYYGSEVGAFENSASPFGTFDQGGNLWELTELQTYPQIVLRGGSWSYQWYGLISSDRSHSASFSYEEATLGFRVASIPEAGGITLDVGTHRITAVYSGDDNFTASTSSPVTQIINLASTSTVNLSPNPSIFGESVTITAAVASVSPGADAPTGTVTFMDGATTLGTGTLSNGMASFTTSTLAVGSHSIIAVYGGDTNFATSTSASVPTTVIDAPPTVRAITAGVQSGTVEAGTQIMAMGFSEDVLNAGTTANYELRGAGADGLLGTVDDQILSLTVSYHDTVATLSVAPLPEGVYRLTIHDAITDLSGNKLDGNSDGNGGGDWVRDFVVTPSSRLFNGTPTYATGGTGPLSVATGDFNDDGVPDVAVANGDGLGVLLGNGSGGFDKATTFASGISLLSVVVSDFNGDGKSDVVAAASNGNVCIMLGDGTGGFSAATQVYAGGSGWLSQSLAMGDFDGDGKLDLAVANGGQNTVGVLLGNGSGGFGPVTTYATDSNYAAAVAVGDLNNDGKPDLAIANINVGTVSVFLNTGSGEFGPAVIYQTDSLAIYSLTIADLNGDGKNDLATGLANGSLGVLLNNGNGRFGRIATYYAGGSDSSLVATDLNGDGKIDLATANACGGTVGVLLGDGSGCFARATTYQSGGGGAYGMTVADLNRDGHVDIVTANSWNNNVGVLFGLGPQGLAISGVMIVEENMPRDGVFTANDRLVMTFNAVDPDGVASVAVQVDGDDITDIGGPYATLPGVNFAVALGQLSTGSHTYSIVATDKLGTLISPRYTGWFTVGPADQQGPTVSGVMVVEKNTSRDGILKPDERLVMTFNAVDPDGVTGATLMVDNKAVEPVGGPYPTSSGANFAVALGQLSAGPHSYSIVATDQHGNPTAPAYSGTFSIGVAPLSTGPTVSGVMIVEQNAPRDGLLKANDQLVMTFNAVDPDGVANATLLVDGNEVTSVGGPYPSSSGVNFAVPFGKLSAGTHSYAIMTTDKLGNETPAAYTGTFAVGSPDLEGPTVSGVMIVEQDLARDGVLTTGEGLVMTFNAVDPDGVAGATLQVDGRNVAPVGGPYASSSGVNFAVLLGKLSAGSHSYSIAATDQHGNPTSSAFTGSFTVVAGLVVDASTPSKGTVPDQPSVGARSNESWDSPLTDQQLAPIVAEAERRLAAVGVKIQIADLPDGLLGEAVGNTILIDRDAAGYGWFIDSTPGDDLEFADVLGPHSPAADNSSPASQRVDLLTTVMHEMGHVLGYEHSDSTDLMYPTLSLGTRRSLGDTTATSAGAVGNEMTGMDALDHVFSSFCNSEKKQGVRV